MIKLRCNLTLLLVFALACCCEAQVKVSHKAILKKALTTDVIEKVTITTSGGSIEVHGITTGEPYLEIFASTFKGDEETLTLEGLKKRIDQDYKVDISVRSKQLNIITQGKNKNMDWRQQINFSIHVYVRPNVSTELNTKGGNFELENLNGKIHGKTAGGNITVQNCKSDIELKTSGGNITADGCEGIIILSTAGGSLDLTNLIGNIKATTSGGSIHGSNITGELIAHTVGSNVNLSNLFCSLEASTRAGNITIGIKEPGKYLKVSNYAGNINLKTATKKGLNLDVYAQKISTNLLNSFVGTQNEQEIRGTLNGGGIPVNIRADGGRLTLTFDK
jgi:hypothetical protein